MKILSIETSCDETAVAVVKNGREVLSSVVYSQIKDHQVFGGVVPEIASRKHIELISGLVEEAIKKAEVNLSDIDCIAVTSSPGLIGALLVGVNFAKGLAYSLKKPLVPVNHIYSHIAANYIDNPELKPPFLALVVSGGHTQIIEVLDYTKFNIISTTRDDAVGEVFDKVARVLGLGYPGGVKIQDSAKNGDDSAYNLPFPKADGFDFSFSGLKTAVINLVHKINQSGEKININNIAASFQKTAVEILITKFLSAAKNYNYKNLVLAGGVSANELLRNRLLKETKLKNYKLQIPALRWCGDNAAMVGVQAYYEYLNNNFASLDLNASSRAF
ncbi:MAG: tRNA (adenosine(37)-N6)-threonylcarbamoyltransferase complex transferase subunit TsaD [Oscillospiraceae bacterium]|nr:tRNA (adenosine(37)-N6)-threonylcarbamoyltransferase complex transferase subunit TsaD [Oscillospiraceae bacterium]